MAKISFFDTPVGLSIVGYLGLTGAGKSLSAVENHVIPDLITGRSVYSNTFVNWKLDNLHTFTKWRELHAVRNSLIFVDELGDLLDPLGYKDFSDEDKNVIRYHRKRGNTIIYTAQDISDIAKQVRVKTHKFVLCEADPDPYIISWFFKTIFNYERVCFKTLVLTFKDLKKLTLGVGSPALESPVEDENENESFSEDISDITDNLSASKDTPRPERLRYKTKALLHNELDPKKIHLYGLWCPQCCGFKSYSDTLVVPDSKCPSCPLVALEIKPLSMYDTNHELTSTVETIITKRFQYITKKVLSPLDSNY